MKVFNLYNSIIVLALLSLASAGKSKNKCCGECPKGQKKYYSVDKLFNRCGECCMPPSSFLKYKIFEPGMHKAIVENPCFELGYTEYENTETHGVLQLKMTLDKYRKPRKHIIDFVGKEEKEEKETKKNDEKEKVKENNEKEEKEN